MSKYLKAYFNIDIDAMYGSVICVEKLLTMSKENASAFLQRIIEKLFCPGVLTEGIVLLFVYGNFK